MSITLETISTPSKKVSITDYFSPTSKKKDASRSAIVTEKTQLGKVKPSKISPKGASMPKSSSAIKGRKKTKAEPALVDSKAAKCSDKSIKKNCMKASAETEFQVVSSKSKPVKTSRAKKSIEAKRTIKAKTEKKPFLKNKEKLVKLPEKKKQNKEEKLADKTGNRGNIQRTNSGAKLQTVDVTRSPANSMKKSAQSQATKDVTETSKPPSQERKPSNEGKTAGKRCRIGQNPKIQARKKAKVESQASASGSKEAKLPSCKAAKIEQNNAQNENQAIDYDTSNIKRLQSDSEILSSGNCANQNDPLNSKLKRLHGRLTITQLKDEALCRGCDFQKIPKLKADLLHFLVEGSIHLCETDAWKQMKALKEQIERERPSLLEASLASKLSHEAKVEEQRRFREKKLEEERRVREQQKEEERRKEREEQAERRQTEIENQRAFHIHSYPFVHAHQLAATRSLSLNCRPRAEHASCEYCGQNVDWYFPATNTALPIWTCEACDFDICRFCFEKQNRSPAEKEKLRVAERKRRLEEERRLRKRIECKERKENIKWDASQQFKNCIIQPALKNKKPDGNKLKGYTVSCAEGYHNTRFHTGNGPPVNEFDTTWSKVEDANARARYLFFWKNCWGMDPQELDNEEIEVTERDGLKTYHAEPDDSGYWTVSVTPDVAFRHLPHSTLNRHNHDREIETLSAASSDDTPIIFI